VIWRRARSSAFDSARRKLHRGKWKFLALAVTAASWLLGVLSAPLVWRGFAWLEPALGLPKLAIEMGFVLGGSAALVAVGAVLHQRL